MKVIKVTEKHLWRDTEPPKCPICKRNIRVGHWVLDHKLSGVDRLRIHVACVKAITEDTPEDDLDEIAVDAQYERIRRQCATAARS